MSDRSVLYFELFEWLEVSSIPWRTVHLNIVLHSDYLQSRGAGEHDGHAYHGCWVDQIYRP